MDQKLAKSLVAAAALAFATLPVTSALANASDAQKSVICYGANACKGKSECKTANSGCAGQNACKGKGYLTMASEKACTDAGGRTKE